MKQKVIALVVLTVFLLMTTIVVAQEQNPITEYFEGKLLPFIQSVATVIVIAFAIFGGLKFLKSDDPAEKDKGGKILIGCIVALAIVWLAPALVEFLKPG